MRNTDVKLHLQNIMFLYRDEISEDLLQKLEDLHDEIESLGPSYFDTEHFKHYVGEEEPPYQDWSQ